MKLNKNPFYNSSGYPDPTAYYGTKDAMKEEKELDKAVHDLMHAIRYIVNLAGFEVIGRIHFKHKETGKDFK